MGRGFTAVIGRLGMPTGDNRLISPGALTSRDLPLPLMWQRQSSDGHAGSVVVGRFETMSFGQDMVTATGTLLDVAEAYEVEQLIEAGVIGPSMDLDDMDYVVDDSERVVITSGRVAGATLVSIPAFAEVSITLDPLPAEPVPEPSEPDADWLYASAAVVADAPPMEWFVRPDEVGPVTVSESGRVAGYVATWGSCHVGLPGCTTAPSSVTGYAHFLRQSVVTASGERVPVGVLTVGGGHADPKLGVLPAMQHYDDVGAAVARVFAGEDEHGIWVAGYVPSYADPEKVKQLADLDVSGDWRSVGGNLELIAVCAVNTPGFPVLKKVSFSLEKGGQQTLIGRFSVERGGPAGPRVDDARAAWARAQWKDAM